MLGLYKVSSDCVIGLVFLCEALVHCAWVLAYGVLDSGLAFDCGRVADLMMSFIAFHSKP
jgi:hypothetical protein